MISLSTSAFYDRSTQQLTSLRDKAASLQQQISTGERLERSSDDPVAAARLRMLSRSEALAKVDTRSSQVAETNLTMSDDTLSSITDVINRARELAVQGSSETLNDDQRKAIGAEIQSLHDNLVTLANSRDPQGNALFGGEGGGMAYTLNGGTVTFTGTTNVTPIEIGDGQTVTPALTGPEVFNFNGPNGATDLFSVLSNLAAALNAGGSTATAGSKDALGQLDSGLDKVTTAQTMIGTRLNWVDVMSNRRIANADRVAQEKSDVGGADIGVTISKLQETMTVLEASQSSFARLANLSLFSILR
ncbi:MAG: flagellar hook-associated protein FlgL [Sphingomonadaceae bacterium]